MTFEEFKDIKTVNELNELGIQVSHFNALPDYYDDFLDSKEHVRLYTTDFSYICSTHRGFIKYIEVEFEDDVVTLFFESLFFCNPPQIKIYELPVSKNNNDNNIRALIKELDSKDFKKIYIVDDYGRSFLGVNDVTQSTEESNFYDTYDYIMSTKDTQKFRTKYRFKYLKEHCNSVFSETLSDAQKEEVFALRATWEKYFPHKVYNSKYFKGAVNYSSSDTFNMLTYYDEELVHYNKVYVRRNGAQRIFSVNAARYKTEDEERNKNIYNIDRYTRIPLLEYLHSMGVDIVYHLGTGGNDGTDGMYDYKMRTHEGCVPYYVIKVGAGK